MTAASTSSPVTYTAVGKRAGKWWELMAAVTAATLLAIIRRVIRA